VLKEQGSSHSGIAGVHVNGRPVLCGAKKDFSEPAILEAAGAGRIPDATVFEIEQFMPAPVWKTQASRPDLTRGFSGGH
jgi:hypothetical protein